jgi:hypothetical protein
MVWTFKVEIFLEQTEIAFLSPSKICENFNFSTEIQNLLGYKKATYLCSKIASTLLSRSPKHEEDYSNFCGFLRKAELFKV